MKVFDVSAVKSFAADLDARMDRCDNGEGMECANLDDTLRHYASLCCEYRERVREWGRAVFSGTVAFDPAVESIFFEGGLSLFCRANEILKIGRTAEDECYCLPGEAQLGTALWDLDRVLRGWVTPKRSVGPSARQTLAVESGATAESLQRIASLPPRPSDWQPLNALQQKQLNRLRYRKTT